MPLESTTTLSEMMKSENNSVTNKRSRIKYVEPNNAYGVSNGIPITPDYTDLCISFDLEVETHTRTGYVVSTNDKNKSDDSKEIYHFYWTSYQSNAKENQVSFSRGEDYLNDSYLTTFYTDINYNDFKNKDIIEGLGVESVSISFENYYMPTIKIRFIDVRGASLFGREEAIHTNNKITQDNVWGCFFTFPYPKFRLQVKGFYGHAITYQLTCLDFRADFDSRTGNFNIDVTFVGYDYGLMSDIPTAYLLAAPYSRYYGQDYWNSQVNSTRWRLADGNPPKTLVEIREKIKSLIRESKRTDDGTPIDEGNNGADDADAINELGQIRAVIGAYNEIIDYLCKNLSEPAFYFKYLQREYYVFTSRTREQLWNAIADKTAVFYEKLEEYKKNSPNRGFLLRNGEELIFGKEIKRNKEFEDEENGHFFLENVFYPKNPLTVETDRVVYEEITDIKKFERLTGSFIEVDDDLKLLPFMIFGKHEYQAIPCGKTLEKLTAIESELVSSIEQNSNKYEFEQAETDDSFLTRLDMYRDVGVLPTIENVFKTIMCHLETFMQMMYECEKTINGQITSGLRTPEKLGIGEYKFENYQFTNTNEETKGTNIPPWVAVTVTEKKGNTGIKENDNIESVGWVGDFKGEIPWEEGKLIDGLAVGILRSQSSTVVTEETNVGNVPIFCLPTDILQGAFPEPVQNDPSNLGQYLGIRAAAMFGVVGYSQNAAEALGKADALNFLIKVGQNYIKNNFNSTWKRKIKEAPSKNNDGTLLYAHDPGCEGAKATIFKGDGDKYRYVYTEAIIREDNQGASKGKKYGMVYIPIGTETDTIGKDNGQPPFISISNGKNYKRIYANFTNTDYKKIKIYHKCGTEGFIAANQYSIQNGNEENIFVDNDYKYNNDAMFNIYGGSELYDERDRIVDAYSKFDAETFTVDNYEDTDMAWRTTLKDYWNINDDNFLEKNISEEIRYCVKDTNNETGSFIFENRIIYAQNEYRASGEDIEMAKCLLFLSSSGYDIRRVIDMFRRDLDKKHIFETIPYGAVLLLGGILLRAEQNEDFIIWPEGNGNSNKNNTTLSYVNFKTYRNNNEYALPIYNPYDIGSGYNADIGLDVKQTNAIGLNIQHFDKNVKNQLINEFKYYFKKGWETVKKYEQRKDGQYYTLAEFINFYKNEKSTEEGKKRLQVQREQFYSDSNVKILDAPVIVSFGRMPRLDDENTEITIDKSCWDSYVDSFCSKLEDIMSYQPTFDSNIPIEEQNKEKDLKKAIYLYMKRIWDRWFMMASPEQFQVENYMQNFIFMDSFYRNIGNLLHINCEKLYEALENINGESMLYQLLSKITTDHNSMFFALPDYFGFGDDESKQENSKNPKLTPEQKIQDMFKAIPFSKKEKMEASNKYIVMHVYNHNESLAHVNDYIDDGFDIFSNDGDFVLPETFNIDACSGELNEPNVSSETKRINRYGYNIPSFGVTFGRMNNHLFKNVSVGMANPIATEQSINALSLVASEGSSSDKKIGFYGQDLFPVFNGYSYNCTVEMMGNAQIMPLMYFQLLNIPMFKGTYMIYSVTHTMRPGDMTTTFKGMKLSKYASPYAEGWYVVSRNGGWTYDENGNLVWVDECVDYGNGSYKLKTGEKEMLISGRMGITRNPQIDIYKTLKGWQTSIQITYHIDEFDEGHEGEAAHQHEKTSSLTVNKWLADDINKIFDKIYTLRVPSDTGPYFAIKSVGCYNDWPPEDKAKHDDVERRFVKNGSTTSKLSYHAYGAAIDINPTQNPDCRLSKNSGMIDKDNDYLYIREGHPIIEIFKTTVSGRPWGWGGKYKDYMHFSFFDGD